MATKEFIEEIIDYVKDNRDRLEFNKKIFEIMEGDLLAQVIEALRQQLSKDNAEIAAQRATPINFWNKIVKKLSRLYIKPVKRIAENPADQELIDYYVNKGIDRHLGNTNENFNAYKFANAEIFEDEKLRELRVRSIPSNQFIMYSNDSTDPLRPTAYIKIMGDYKDASGTIRDRLWIYTDDEFISVLDNGEIVESDLLENDGINPFGIIPAEYISMSEYLLVPMPDRDTLQMSILIPVLMSDTNFGSMFLSFPLITVTDGDAENMPATPNHFINLKSDNLERAAAIQVVRAEPDLDAQLNNAMRQLDAWLESRDIHIEGIGQLTASNIASGLSKAISQLDTTENRKQQEILFRAMEKSFWRRLAIMHNTLAKVGRIDNRKLFSDPDNLNISIQFADEVVFESRADKIARLALEQKAGFTSKRKAIAELNPDMNEEQIDSLIEEIDLESASIIEVNEDSEIDGEL